MQYPIYTSVPSTMGRIYAGDDATIPLSFLLDGEGRVLEVLEGWSEETVLDWLAPLESVDEEPGS